VDAVSADNAADVIVVGLGAMGAHALWRLASRGAEALGIEQFTPGHDRGASHGESRIIRTAYAEGQEYVPLLLHAWRLWADLEWETGEELVTRTGGLMLAAPDAPFITGPVESARAHGLKYEILSAAEIRRRYPQHLVDDSMVGCFEADAGFVRPERAVLAALAAARRAGARVLTRTRVTEIDPARPAVLVDGRWLHCRRLVIAAGAWLPTLVPTLACALRPVRRVMGWCAVDPPTAFAPDRFPIFVREDPAGRGIWYGFPQLDGATVKLALHTWLGIDERVDAHAGPLPPHCVDGQRMASAVAGSLRGVCPYPVRMTACTYTLTPDHHFVVGIRREWPAVTLLGGFSGHGFKFAPVIGDAAADLALNGRSDWAVPLFDPHRFDGDPN
jgi:sarcosine oxidase